MPVLLRQIVPKKVAQYGTMWHNWQMLSIKLNSELIERMQKLNNAIADLYIKVNAYSNDENAAIHRYAKISMIGASTRIENALLTDSEINWLDTVLSSDGKITALEKNKALIENKLSKDRERSIEEVAGCRNMLTFIYENAKSMLPIRETDIRAMHDMLMRPYLKDAPTVGNYKIQPNSVIEVNHATNASRTVFQTADAGPITKVAMHDLITWYNEVYPIEPWTVAVVAELTYRFLAIHPFQDGNGRMGRGLFLLGLLQANNNSLATVAKYLAIDRQIEKHKEEYYFVLNQCSKGKFSSDPANYQMEYFLAFMLKMLEKSLLDVNLYHEKFIAVQKLSLAATKVLECFKEFPELRLNTKKICELTNLPRRTAVNALNNLLHANLIQKYGAGTSVRYQITF